MDNYNGWWKQERKVGIAEVVGRCEGKGRKLYLNNNKKMFKKIKKIKYNLKNF